MSRASASAADVCSLSMYLSPTWAIRRSTERMRQKFPAWMLCYSCRLGDVQFGVASSRLGAEIFKLGAESSHFGADNIGAAISQIGADNSHLGAANSQLVCGK